MREITTTTSTSAPPKRSYINLGKKAKGAPKTKAKEVAGKAEKVGAGGLFALQKDLTE